jgi:hypothetical protein
MNNNDWEMPLPPFYARQAVDARNPGSEPDHPGAHHVPLPPSTYGEFEDYRQPPPPAFLPQQHLVPNVVLPPFKVNRPAAWFAQCADLFRMRGVHDQRDMFALCYNILGDEQQAQVDDIAEALPRPPDAFFRLRDRLVASHSLDVGQRVKQLLELPALGGQRLSALLAHMRQLCPPGEEQGEIFRQLFIQRLPAQVRLQLAEDRHSPVQALAARADTLMANHSYGAVASVKQEEEPVVVAVRDNKQKDDRKKQWRKGGRGGDKTTGGKQEPWHILGICKRHYDFGKECYKCVDPSTCKWTAGN